MLGHYLLNPKSTPLCKPAENVDLVRLIPERLDRLRQPLRLVCCPSGWIGSLEAHQPGVPISLIIEALGANREPVQPGEAVPDIPH